MGSKIILYENEVNIRNVVKAILPIFVMCCFIYIIYLIAYIGYYPNLAIIPFSLYLVVSLIIGIIISFYIYKRMNRLKSIYFKKDILIFNFNFSDEIKKLNIKEIDEVIKLNSWNGITNGLKIPSILETFFNVKYFFQFKNENNYFEIPINSNDKKILNFIKKNFNFKEKYDDFPYC
jgi:hypothetical protein